jgi:fluoroacetyl-CoA thioesterase
MKASFTVGDHQYYQHVVTLSDRAAFHQEVVHSVYATFALARDAEWTCRQFVLGMREDDEEGIGTFLEITHHKPAFVDECVVFDAVLTACNGNEIMCTFEASVGNRLVATGRTGQKIIKRERLAGILQPSKDEG